MKNSLFLTVKRLIECFKYAICRDLQSYLQSLFPDLHSLQTYFVSWIVWKKKELVTSQR